MVSFDSIINGSSCSSLRHVSQMFNVSSHSLPPLLCVFRKCLSYIIITSWILPDCCSIRKHALPVFAISSAKQFFSIFRFVPLRSFQPICIHFSQYTSYVCVTVILYQQEVVIVTCQMSDKSSNVNRLSFSSTQHTRLCFT